MSDEDAEEQRKRKGKRKGRKKMVSPVAKEGIDSC
jgi:hypothetical protein